MTNNIAIIKMGMLKLLERLTRVLAHVDIGGPRSPIPISGKADPSSEILAGSSRQTGCRPFSDLGLTPRPTGLCVHQHRAGTTLEITCRRRIAGATRSETAGRVIFKRYDELRGERTSYWAELRSRTRPSRKGAVNPTRTPHQRPWTSQKPKTSPSTNSRSCSALIRYRNQHSRLEDAQPTRQLERGVHADDARWDNEKAPSMFKSDLDFAMSGFRQSPAVGSHNPGTRHVKLDRAVPENDQGAANVWGPASSVFEPLHRPRTGGYSAGSARRSELSAGKAAFSGTLGLWRTGQHRLHERRAIARPAQESPCRRTCPQRSPSTLAPRCRRSWPPKRFIRQRASYAVRGLGVKNSRAAGRRFARQWSAGATLQPDRCATITGAPSRWSKAWASIPEIESFRWTRSLINL